MILTLEQALAVLHRYHRPIRVGHLEFEQYTPSDDLIKQADERVRLELLQIHGRKIKPCHMCNSLGTPGEVGKGVQCSNCRGTSFEVER